MFACTFFRVILAALAGSCWAAASENPPGKLEAGEFAGLLRGIAEQNIAAAGAIKSIYYSGTKETKLDPMIFDGLEKESSKLDFAASGERYSLEYEVISVPLEKTSTRVTCRYDGENWGRLEDDQYKVLFTSKKNQRDKVAILGTNFFCDPFLPISWLSQRSGIYDELIAKDLGDAKIWKKCFDLATSAELVEDPALGKLAVVTFKDTSDAANEKTFVVSFSLAKAFYPVKWSMSANGVYATEFSVLELGEAKIEGVQAPFFYPKKARLTRQKSGKIVSEAEFEIEKLEINGDLADEKFSLPIEHASSIIDLETDVAISIPK